MKSVTINKHKIITLLASIFLVTLWFHFSSPSLSYQTANEALNYTPKKSDTKTLLSKVDGGKDDIYSNVIMPKMPDQKAKQELGRTSWKYFHTVLARFPDEPSSDERQKLDTFLHLFAELYPCGECSYHFVELLKKYPPQTSSRFVAAMWGCHVHNVVNQFLKKDEYDCSTILEDYDCGCGDEATAEAAKTVDSKVEKNGALTKGSTITLEKEGKQHG
ncbi:hypothetical protein ACO0RG_004449 [Hanseniaspora osmophila]